MWQKNKRQAIAICLEESKAQMDGHGLRRKLFVQAHIADFLRCLRIVISVFLKLFLCRFPWRLGSVILIDLGCNPLLLSMTFYQTYLHFKKELSIIVYQSCISAFKFGQRLSLHVEPKASIVSFMVRYTWSNYNGLNIRRWNTGKRATTERKKGEKEWEENASESAPSDSHLIVRYIKKKKGREAPSFLISSVYPRDYETSSWHDIHPIPKRRADRR